MHPVEPGEDGVPRVHPEDAAEWHAWLAAHHAAAAGVWSVRWRGPRAAAELDYDGLVRGALCFGWIDSRPQKLDQDRTMLYFSPRRPGSGWARPNKLRIVELERDGLMAPAGRAAIARAKADGSWTLLDEVEDAVEPGDLIAALDATPGAREAWDGFPPSARKALLQWIVQAKRPETRARRIAETADKASRGERANEWRPRG
ncbi:YdeI/OmpD-associated family protein [Demequina silvatica]|uniref:YdeI/OmpD-associated family protein n=1 Tax=Demequina silvatica TaxID=1638988 RepID=UPI0007809DAF|nr:YdeI/OmpD-associated family protein [Demequina silvatica]